MPCHHPITGYRSRYLTKNGKRPIVFSASEGFIDQSVEVPCGRCIGCRIDYSREWALRCMHEAQMHESNSFITLTYAPEHLPDDHSISIRELQLFFKRLRKELDVPVRYFACGEYGEERGRPHYHAIIFGYDFSDDRTLWSKTDRGDLVYRSKTLEKCWTFGHSSIGSVSFESCAYVARYVMKKRKGADDYVDPETGKTNAEHYKLIDPETGEVIDLQPEFCVMSRRPGIGRSWIEKYKNDTDKDFVTLDGNKFPLPKYYDQFLANIDEEKMKQRKVERMKKVDKEDNTRERLAVKEQILERKLTQLSRNLGTK